MRTRRARRRADLARALPLAASAIALAAAPLAHAAAIGGVRLSVNGHPGPRVELATLADNRDVPPFQATTLQLGGSSSRDTHSGTSAAELTRLAGLDPAHVRTLSVRQPFGTGAAVLRSSEIVGGFPDGPAVFELYDNTEVHFFRPQRDPGDVNAPDAVDPPLRTDLEVAVTTDGGVLSVTAGADRLTVAVGEPVILHATATGGSGAVRYAWDFGDGADATSPTGDAAHAYATAAAYDAVVTAYTRAGDSGVAIVHVQVDPPAGAQGGEQRGGGGHTVQAGGGDGGRGAPSSGRVRGRAHGTTGQGVGRAEDDARVQDRSTRTRRQTRSDTTTPRHARTMSARREHAGRVHARRRHARRRDGAAPVPASTPRISGVLLASSGDPASVLAGLPADARSPRRDAVARAAATDGASLGGWLLGGLALAALLGLGAAREAGVRIVRRPRAAA